jgi:putative endonuclease
LKLKINFGIINKLFPQYLLDRLPRVAGQDGRAIYPAMRGGLCIMVYLYILQSKKDNKYYIGITNDVEQRLKMHNNRKVLSTKTRVPFILVHQEIFESYKEARLREKEVKGYKGGIKFKYLLNI